MEIPRHWRLIQQRTQFIGFKNGHGPQLVDRPHTGEGGSREKYQAELRDRIHQQDLLSLRTKRFTLGCPPINKRYLEVEEPIQLEIYRYIEHEFKPKLASRLPLLTDKNS